MDEEERRAQVQRWYVAHRDSVARHLLAYIGRDAVVEDLVMETFVRAFEAYGAFEGRSSAKTWIHGIALNVARNEVAKRRRRQESGPPTMPRQAGSTPEEEVRRQEAIDRFYAALHGLDPNLRDAFVLRVIEERKLKDVADCLGVPISTVHARVRKAEASLRGQVLEPRPAQATGEGDDT